jgi:hypothetical protein
MRIEGTGSLEEGAFEGDFRGIVDLIDMKAIYYDDTPDGTDLREEAIPPELAESARSAAARMLERVSEPENSVGGPVLVAAGSVSALSGLGSAAGQRGSTTTARKLALLEDAEG